MSGRVFQNIVLQFKDAVDTEIGVIDAEGTVIACTELSEIGSHWSELVSSINDAEESVVPLAGKTFKALSGWNGHFDFAVFSYGENEMSRAACSMAAVALNAAKSYYEEKYDKVSFIKNIISDNIMLSDLYIRAKELHVETELNRGVFLIRRLDERFEGLTVEAVQNIFPDRQTSFALSMGESDVVLIQQLGENVGTRDLEKTAQLIEETLRENGESTVVVGIGTVAAHLRDLAKSYKEAQIAIEVGKVFDTEKYVVSYENLGIGRLIYQLPTTLCEMFLQDGARIIFETYVDVKHTRNDFYIEELEGNFDGLNFLANQNMSVVNRKAMEGTILAHTDGGVPLGLIEVDSLSAHDIGELIYFFWRACAVSGYLLSVNPFDQPGVESYKKNMFALLGKPGYEDRKAELEAALKE